MFKKSTLRASTYYCRLRRSFDSYLDYPKSVCRSLENTPHIYLTVSWFGQAIYTTFCSSGCFGMLSRLDHVYGTLTRGWRVRKLVPHIGLIAKLISLKLLLDYSRLQKSQDCLEIVDSITNVVRYDKRKPGEIIACYQPTRDRIPRSLEINFLLYRS